MAGQRIRATLLAITAWLISANSAFQAAAEKPGRIPLLARSLQPKIPLPTLGGTQFWGDEYIFHQWHIQRRVGTENYRLLDRFGLSHAAGTFDQCRTALERIKRQQGLEPMRGRAVVMLHGLGATRSTLSLLGRYLRQKGGFTIVNVEYPSTRQPVADHAQALARVIEGLPQVDQINFVGHSLGNIVIRQYLADQAKRAERADRPWPDPRLGRFVMIAPPNHGSIEAQRLSEFAAFRAILGRPGQQLGPEWSWLESNLATPPCPFGIIAGGRGNQRGFSMLLPGDDDGRIRVETTRLAGAADFVLVPMIHELIANDPRTLGYVLRFLEDGYFVAPDRRHPVH